MRPLARKVLSAEYAMLRTPLAVLDQKVISRLPERFPVRRVVEKGIESLDKLAHRTLHSAPSTAPVTPAERLQALDGRQPPATELGERDRGDVAELMAKHRVEELKQEQRLREAEPERFGPAAEVKKAAARKAPAKKTPAKTTTAKKTPAKKAPAKATSAKQTPAKETTAKKTPAKKKTTVKRTTGR